MSQTAQPVIEIKDLNLGYGDIEIMQGLNFTVNKGDVFIVMGVSGCGKSTLFKSMIGLKAPAKGKILYEGKSFWEQDQKEQQNMMKSFGILYQSGALWSSMSVGENVALPLQLYSKLSSQEIQQKVAEKLKQVDMEGQEQALPSQLSGGMRKRASLARAIVLDPTIIFFDAPSAGLDPINSRKLDDLVLELRDSLGATIITISHELPSILTIGNNSVFLDMETKTMIATGDPKILLKKSKDPRVIQFLTRGKTEK